MTVKKTDFLLSFTLNEIKLAQIMNNMHAIISCLGDGLHSKPNQFLIMVFIDQISDISAEG